MMIKTGYNFDVQCVDEIIDFVKDILHEANVALGSYYDI